MIEVPIRSKTSKKRLPDDDVEIGFRSYTFEELDKALKQTIKKYRSQSLATKAIAWATNHKISTARTSGTAPFKAR